ncbi:FKBP-type peptidyl-prolyl cis-trans isomerase [Leucobacter denitrificans]|uniref:peptidylprolyl isomerase n=1 Tax=Leucobacter denitrificans TaxID=683042 RepID=A0A7G9S6S0_9MICO|nr:FKBP-type peptidyl-prolyl cis-trans isomerase [Leucobacter denitrificans]QNN63545.1 FKBP-type peptidyl-prolyl cis-trans isomerase [Leucobacter denitrificans]
MKLSRVFVPLAATALLLTGCSAGGGANTDASGEDCLAPGSASKTIEVTGEVGNDLEITSETPVSVEATERSVLKEGEGESPTADQTIEVAMSMFNGADGTSLQQVATSPIPAAQEQLATWAYEGIRCAVPGEQIAIVTPYADVFGTAAAEETGLEGITEEDSIVIVMEFGEVADSAASTEPGTLEADELLSRAEGKAVAAPDGFPTVKLDDDGAPTITMPEGVDAPTELSIATIIEGDGETVQAGDRVYVNYRGVIWRTGEEFDSSWSRGAPTDFLTTQVIGGFQKALEGQKVGSQIISVVPAEDGGYGAASLEQMGHEPDDVMVFVLDILGTVHAE